MATTAVRSPEERRRRSGLFLLLTVFCTATASIAQLTVLGKLVYDLTDSTFALGMLGLAEFLPSALLVLVTGAVADRVDRRIVTAVAAVGEAIVAGGLAWYAGTDPTSATPIFLLVVAFGVCRAFVGPASRALPADIVPPAQLPKLVARYSVTWQGSLILGPVTGGLLYAADVRLPFLFEMALFLIAAAAVMAVQVIPHPAVPRLEATVTGDLGDPLNRAELRAEAAREAAVDPVVGHAGAATPEPTGLHEALEGLRFIRGRPILLGAISLDLFAVLFGGAVALLPAIAKDRLGVGAVGLGWLRAAGGIGAGMVTLSLAVRPVTRYVGRVLLAVVAAFGLFTILLGITRSFAVAFVALALLSGADAVSVYIRSTLVPLVTPQDKRGRVMAVEMVFIGASNELGAFESGVAGSVVGTAGAVVLGGVGTLAVALGWWWLFPSLRKVDGFPNE